MPANASVAQLNEVREQLTARVNEFSNALPSHIRPEYFQRATLTAISQNPDLLSVDRRSLFNALMRCAQDGLIPDGRQAALVIFKDRDRGRIAQYMQMAAGVRILVQQSGEVTRFEQTVVYENDKFDYRLGDRPHIAHVPAIADRGKPSLVYSIAQFRDGTLSREVMTVEEIEKVRQVSHSKDRGPWVEWWSEMARKTVAKRHAKSLPMSNDAAVALAREDREQFTLAPPQVADLAPPQRPRLTQQLDALSQTSETTRRRGRPPKPKPIAGEGESNADQTAASSDDETDGAEDADFVEIDGQDESGPDLSADYKQGEKDAEAGHTSCLNRDIRDDPDRLHEWQRGYASVAHGARRA